MRRAELEHAFRAATEIIAVDSVIVIGSQAILGSFTEQQLPPEATASVEVDMAPLHDDDAGALATRIDGAIGELSLFHQTHGFYVQGVGKDTAVLPAGWEDRLVPVQVSGTNGRTGLCLDPHDLCVAKLAAHREKDLRFVTALLTAGLVHLDEIVARTRMLPPQRARTAASIQQWIESNRWTDRTDEPDTGTDL